MTEAATSEPALRPCRVRGCAWRVPTGLCREHEQDIERGCADPGQLEHPEGES